MPRALFLCLPLSAPVAEAQELRFRFIGNSGFEISDNVDTILLDFPYESGAYGYMTFDSGEVHARRSTLCLFSFRPKGIPSPCGRSQTRPHNDDPPCYSVGSQALPRGSTRVSSGRSVRSDQLRGFDVADDPVVEGSRIIPAEQRSRWLCGHASLSCSKTPRGMTHV
jgi:hypothetical protein